MGRLIRQAVKRALQCGFTLIELLVVVGIIVLLAAILMPALGRARGAARSASCMGNLKNISAAIHIYTTANGGLYPTCYTYNNGESSSGGYFHWTAAIEKDLYTESDKYPRTAAQYVCPTHPQHGFAPSCFTSARIPNPPAGQVSQKDTLDDAQAPRLSYVPNEALMPRKKFGSSHDADPLSTEKTSDLCLVNEDEVRDPGNTILMAEFSDVATCIYGSSAAGAQAYKSHRPTNAIKTSEYQHPKDAVGTLTRVFDAEVWTTLATKPSLFKLTHDEALTAINTGRTTPDATGTTLHHISYVNPNAHGDTSNYLFVDGHVAAWSLEKTLDPGNYMWGDKMYSIYTKPVIQDNP